jgi:hypothetical protein
MGRLTAYVAVLCVLLTACNAGSSPPSMSSDPFTSSAVPNAQEGVAAHYVVEFGTFDGSMQGDVRQIQQPSVFAQPSAGANAVITYPDGSTQTAAADGTFDASASSFAQAHPEDLAAADAQIAVSIPGTSVASFTTQVWVPSVTEEAEDWSGMVATSQAASRVRTSRALAAPACPAVASAQKSGSTSAIVQAITTSKTRPSELDWYQTFTNNTTDARNGANATLAACGTASTPIGALDPPGVLATGCQSTSTVKCGTTTTTVNGVTTTVATFRFRVKYKVVGTFSTNAWQYDELFAVPPKSGAGWQKIPVALVKVCSVGRVC